MLSAASTRWFFSFVLLVAPAAGTGPLMAGTVVATNFALGSANADTSHPLTSGDGTSLIPNSTGFIAVGTFDGVTDAQIVAADTSAEWAAVVAGFTQFGPTGQIGGPTALNTAGLFKLTTSVSVSAGSPFLNRAIYLVMGNGATAASSTEHFVFKSTRTFPDDGSGLAPVVSLTGTPDGSLLQGKLRRGAQVYYADGALARQLLQPITIDDGFEEQADPYDTWIDQFFPPSDPRGDPMADPDEDGFANGRERGAGTLPNDFASAPRVLSMNLLTQDVTVLTWSAVTGRKYDLRASEDGVTFSKVGSTTATGTTQSFALNAPRPASWFFKVDVYAPWDAYAP